MDPERDLEMQMAISNMLSDLGKQIKEPLTDENMKNILRTIHLSLIFLAENKQNIISVRLK